MNKISGYFKASIAALALSTATTATADIRGSQHDLGAGTGQGTSAATTEVCVFCHTPHGSDTTAPAPLWNKTFPTSTYQRYSSLGTATLDGTEVAVGSVSLACLSCHDGTQAMDVVINGPGSGNYNPAGAEIDTTSIGVMTGAPVPMLGTDLRNDHPVSIEYAGGACTGTTADCDPATAVTGDPDFVTAQYQLLNGQNLWWVDVSTTTTPGTPNLREKTDMILYTRSFAGTDGPSVECASCHDPHEAAARPVSFMRVSNDNSDVCLACHIK